MRRTTAYVLLLAATTPALAQTSSAEIVFDIDNDTLLPGQSTTVTMAALWNEGFAMCCVGTDLLISTGSEGWSDLRLIAPMDGPGTSAGALTPLGIEGVLAGKLNFPSTGVPPDPNPILFWQGTYTAPSDIAEPFDINLTTQTSMFEVYIEFASAETQSLMDVLTEGNATIRVIPAPASAIVLPGLAVARRRRR